MYNIVICELQQSLPRLCINICQCYYGTIISVAINYCDCWEYNIFISLCAVASCHTSTTGLPFWTTPCKDILLPDSQVVAHKCCTVRPLKASKCQWPPESLLIPWHSLSTPNPQRVSVSLFWNFYHQLAILGLIHWEDKCSLLFFYHCHSV